MRAPYSYTLQKRSSSLLQFGQEDKITGQSIKRKSLLICFENCQGVPYSHRQSRNGMLNTFIIVNITLACKR